MSKWFVGSVALVVLLAVTLGVGAAKESPPPTADMGGRAQQVPYLPACGLEFTVIADSPGTVPPSTRVKAMWSACTADVDFEASWTGQTGERVEFRVSPPR